MQKDGPAERKDGLAIGGSAAIGTWHGLEVLVLGAETLRRDANPLVKRHAARAEPGTVAS